MIPIWITIPCLIAVAVMGAQFWREAKQYKATRRALEDYWFAPAPLDDRTTEMPVLSGRHSRG